ncbi:hypothetical protein ACFY2R_12985 [Micromonospora olivasterospora]|uniref:hypothetical protein n=1 Tax=Micromonospora olivasterospora TaxID=1880 RepID=UPI0011A4CEB2|nr:hypothetical protein [Micromonospora olivasterospora]
MAFVAQLIVSLAQAHGTSQQLTQTERINSETQATLAEVRSTAHALLTNQSDQFNKVLAAALRSATESAVREVTESSEDTGALGQGNDELRSVDPVEVADQVERRLRDLLTQQAPTSNVVRLQTIHQLDFSEPVGREAIKTFYSLSQTALLYFLTLTSSTRFRRTNHLRPAPNPAFDELLKAGIFEASTARANREYSLTAKGEGLFMLVNYYHAGQKWFARELAARISLLG